MKRFLNAAGVLLMVLGMAGIGQAADFVPEISPSLAASAVTLLAGGILVLRARRGR